jgi:hypothetical protein
VGILVDVAAQAPSIGFSDGVHEQQFVIRKLQRRLYSLSVDGRLSGTDFVIAYFGNRCIGVVATTQKNRQVT